MNPLFSAFLGPRLLITGSLDEVKPVVAPFVDHAQGPLLVFDHATGRQVDVDLRESSPAPAKVGPGRPKLGVVSTEVTLLPRHWEWLNAQPARASGTLRRLVEEAMAAEALNPQKRREALGQILWALAGNEPGFEEATRALYAGDQERLIALTAGWPGDLPPFVREWK